MTLQFKRLHSDAQLPKRANPGDAGYDLVSVEAVSIPPGRRALIDTGLAVAIPEDHYGRIAPRSGLAVKAGVNLGAGVVDSGYRGPVKVLVFNHGVGHFVVAPGDRIAQIILERISTPEPEWAEELPETVRGDGGFGSSGK